jgi:hypothetical protein
MRTTELYELLLQVETPYQENDHEKSICLSRNGYFVTRDECCCWWTRCLFERNSGTIAAASVVLLSSK